MRVTVRKVSTGFQVTTHPNGKDKKLTLCAKECPAHTKAELKDWIKVELPKMLEESAQTYVDGLGAQRYIGNGGN